MIAEPTPTPYDLKFRSFGFPVRVHPLFWVISALLGANLLNDPDHGVLFLLMWVGVSFVSILVHELGHGFAYRHYGGDGRLWLYWFGGLAISDTARPNAKQRIVIALAGPGAGFLLAATVLLTNRAAEWATASVLTAELYWQLMWVNLAWGVVNLLPIVPLDGGQVTREVCTLLRLRRPLETALKISIGAAGACVLYSLLTMLTPPRELAQILPWWMPAGSLYTVMMFGFLAYGSWQQLQFLSRYSSYGWNDPDDDTPPWRRRR
ncbi:MAG: site-2 protease family protein [Bacteroidales bacterium]|nr:site-2 protease family protein [Bacteroidales bacterium]